MNRNDALDSAKAAINRAPKSYGVPREHFERVARLWNAHIRGIGLHLDGGLKPEDVAIMLGLVKIARLEHDPAHADSWCDLAGYAACGAEVSEPERKSSADLNGIIPIVVRPGETMSEAAHRTLYDHRKAVAAKIAKSPWAGAPLYTDDMDAVGSPFPPESKWGFTVGETVNSVNSAHGSLPGTVAGFTDKSVLVRWNHGRSTDAPQEQPPHDLRNGA